jgi:hypothetical protein
MISNARSIDAKQMCSPQPKAHADFLIRNLVYAISPFLNSETSTSALLHINMLDRDRMWDSTTRSFSFILYFFYSHHLDFIDPSLKRDRTQYKPTKVFKLHHVRPPSFHRTIQETTSVG